MVRNLDSNFVSFKLSDSFLFSLRKDLLQTFQALGDVEEQVNECPIGGAFYLKIPEEHVGFEVE